MNESDKSKRKLYLHFHHDFVEKNAISQVGDRLYECTSLESIISLQIIRENINSVTRSREKVYHCSKWPVLHQHCLQTVKHTNTANLKKRPAYPNDKRTVKKTFCSRHAFKRSSKLRANYTQGSTVTVRCSSLYTAGQIVFTTLMFTRSKRSKYHLADRNIQPREMSNLCLTQKKRYNH